MLLLVVLVVLLWLLLVCWCMFVCLFVRLLLLLFKQIAITAVVVVDDVQVLEIGGSQMVKFLFSIVLDLVCHQPANQKSLCH